jgi:hypothetical protein
LQLGGIFFKKNMTFTTTFNSIVSVFALLALIMYTAKELGDIGNAKGIVQFD